MNQTDIFYINHEYCISDRGAPLSGKYYTFRAKPERMELLKQMGTDLVALANNHVFDYGKDALIDTTKLLQKAAIPYVGGGIDIEEAKRPVYFIVNGMKIGFVGASNAEKLRYTPQPTEDTPGILRAYDTTEYNAVIQEASKNCDYLIAYIHWGTEDSNYLNSLQQSMGREFLNSGADIVVGGHPHVLQGMEYVDGKPIVYSLGDFWFNSETKYTGLLKLRINFDGLKEMSFVPALQTNYTTQHIETFEKQRKLFDFLEELSINIKIDDKGVITQK
jgi:poly-gamma-glutamate synthesis protein (capsule biosynthesis protein)